MQIVVLLYERMHTHSSVTYTARVKKFSDPELSCVVRREAVYLYVYFCRILQLCRILGARAGDD